jgi:hypothetical protein
MNLGSGRRASSRILNTENTTFRKLRLFPSSGEGSETPALLGSLESANLNHWTQQWVAAFHHSRTKTGPFSKPLCVVVFRILDDEQSLET